MRRGKRRVDYEYIRAWGRFRQYPQDMIEQQVDAARLQNAGSRVIYFDIISGQWYTVDDLAPDLYRLIIEEYEQRHVRARQARKEQKHHASPV